MNQKRKEFCFRLEQECGTGIYQGFDKIHPVNASTQHPTPYGDAKLKDIWDALTNDIAYTKYFFGFSSIEQLRQWFWCQDWCSQAQEDGVRICIYHTDDYHIGDTQMIFRKSTAILIGKADLI